MRRARLRYVGTVRATPMMLTSHNQVYSGLMGDNSGSLLLEIAPRAGLITATTGRSSEVLFGKPATADKSEIGWLGARVRPSDHFRDQADHREPQKDPHAIHEGSVPSPTRS